MEARSVVDDPADGHDGVAQALQHLTDVAVAITSAFSLDETLENVTRVAAELVGARLAATTLTLDEDWRHAVNVFHLSDEYASWRDYDAVPDGSGIYAEVVRTNRPIRLTQEELEADARWRGFGGEAERHPPLRGWLAVPLIGREGRNLGIVQVSDKVDGDFTPTDESLLVQVAALAAVAVEKARLRDELARQETARFREDLLSGISHDMQTPLATIVGLTDVLLSGVPDPEELTQTHEILNRQARSLRGLVQQFLDYSRLASDRELLLRPRPVDVVEVIERAVGMFRHQRDIVVGASLGLPPAEVDPDRFEQMLTNLIDNAMKYSDGPIRVVARHQGDRITVDVVDEGPGIDEQELETLFEKFHRGDDAEGTTGTGLGLYITRALVEAHGGELRTHSTPGVGSRFQIRLPAADGSRRP